MKLFIHLLYIYIYSSLKALKPNWMDTCVKAPEYKMCQTSPDPFLVVESSVHFAWVQLIIGIRE